MTKNVTIVIPVFNEEEILESKIVQLLQDIDGKFDNFEIIISENGSTDATKDIARSLEAEHATVRAIIDDEAADYGQALVLGIEGAKYDEVAILELDYLDLDFLYRGCDLLSEYDYVVGSKKLSPGIDQRPFKRRFFTGAYNFILKMLFWMPITETHGLKTLRRSKVLEILSECVTKHAVFPTELTIRAWKHQDINVKEIPLAMPLREIRTTRISAAKRLKKTLQDLWTLRRALKKSKTASA